MTSIQLYPPNQIVRYITYIIKGNKRVDKLPTLTKIAKQTHATSRSHLASQNAYNSTESFTDDVRGEATSTVPASQTTLQIRYKIMRTHNLLHYY